MRSQVEMNVPSGEKLISMTFGMGNSLSSLWPSEEKTRTLRRRMHELARTTANDLKSANLLGIAYANNEPSLL